MTNFKTIKETKEEIQKVAASALDDVGKLYNYIQELAKGADPEVVIKSEKYRTLYPLYEAAENAYGLIDEYIRDINTLRGDGARK